MEDFEDYHGISPGIYETVNGGIGLGASVDADDGLIDEDGSQGRSMTGGGGICTISTCGLNIRFIFDDVALGAYPNRAGFVVTSGENNLGIIIRVIDSLGETEIFDISAYSFASQSVTDDSFFGVRSNTGIKEISIANAFNRLPPPPNILKIDHLLYGIPEPSSLTACLIAILLGWLKRR